MGRVRDLIDNKKREVEERCREVAEYIIESDHFTTEISNALENNESSASFDIDYLLRMDLGHEPSDSEWRLIMEMLSSLLETEGVRLTNYGWDYNEETEDTEFFIHLEW